MGLGRRRFSYNMETAFLTAAGPVNDSVSAGENSKLVQNQYENR